MSCVPWEERGHLLFTSISNGNIKCDSSIHAFDHVWTKTFGFSMGSLIVFLQSHYSPLIMPLETENILQFWLDQDVNFCFCICDHLFILNSQIWVTCSLMQLTET